MKPEQEAYPFAAEAKLLIEKVISSYQGNHAQYISHYNFYCIYLFGSISGIILLIVCYFIFPRLFDDKVLIITTLICSVLGFFIFRWQVYNSRNELNKLKFQLEEIGLCICYDPNDYIHPVKILRNDDIDKTYSVVPSHTPAGHRKKIDFKEYHKIFGI